MKNGTKPKNDKTAENMAIGVAVAIPIAIIVGMLFFDSIGIAIAFAIPIGIVGGLLYSEQKKKQA